jgi:hypothetical protein
MAKKRIKNCATNIAHFRRDCNISEQSTPILGKKKQKPQICSIPGVSPKQRDRYRVVLGDRILGDFLTLDEALLLTKGGAK